MNRTGPRRAANMTIVVVLIAAAVLVAGTFLLRRGRGENNSNGSPDTFVVRRGGFDITVPASGELAAIDQVEIKCELETRAVITYIIEEGKWVQAEEVLVRLNDEDIRDRLKDEEDAVNSAETSLTTAEANLEIRRSSHASEMASAELQVRLAELALEAWTNGDDVSNRERMALELKAAKKDYERLVDRYDRSVELESQGFISKDELERDEISMIQAESRLRQAQLAIEVYNKYQSVQDYEELNSDVEQTKDERKRIELRHASEIRSLESEVEAKRRQLESRQERLAKAQRQLQMCVITAPKEGLVVYASSLQSGRYWRGDDQAPQIGTELRRKETVIVLPDTSQMKASVKVNEALSGKIQTGQKAVVMSDAVPDTPISGEVLRVGVLAESYGWRDPNRRDYTVEIELADGNDLGLKPSMRCKADIYVGRVDDALYAPIQAVFRKGAVAYVYVPDGSGYAERSVTLGRSSELFIEVVEGLEEGEVVLLRQPAPDQIRVQVDGDSGVNGPSPPPGAGADPATERPEAERPGAGDKRPQGRGGGGQQPGGPKPPGRRRGAPAGQG